MDKIRLHERIAAAERKHGQRQGDPIPGSDRVRAYCCGCFEPIRVMRLGVRNYCEDCNPGKRPMDIRR